MTEATNVVLTEVQPVEFRFRENRDGYKRPTLTLQLPLLTAHAIMQAFATDEEGKYITPNVVKMIIDTMNGTLIQYVRSALSGDENFTQETLDAMVEKGEISLIHLANLPKSERNVITNADLAAFAKVFVEVAQAVEQTDKRIASVGGATLAAQAFTDRLRAAAGKNDILDKLNNMLEKFTEVASEEILDEHIATVEWLFTKMVDARKADELSLSNLD